MDIPEMVIWATLNYRLLEYGELENLYQKRAEVLGLENIPHCGAYIDRLLQRGLIADGHGERGHDALYDLLSVLHIVPVPTGASARASAFLKRTIRGRLPLSYTKRLLKKPRLSDSEQKILTLCNEIHLSVAEVICCMENGYRDITSEADVLHALYSDEYTTSDNICGEARALQCEASCLTDIANLYLRQCLLFEQ